MQVYKQNQSRTFIHTQLATSKLITIYYVYTCTIIVQEAKEMFEREIIASWGQFQGCSSPDIVHMQFQPEKEDLH